MGRYHYRMTYQDDLPTNRANDVFQAEASAAEANDYKSISYSDSPDNNVAAPAEMGKIMKWMHEGALVSPGASSEMLEMMKNARDDRMILGISRAKSSWLRRAAPADESRATWASSTCRAAQ